MNYTLTESEMLELWMLHAGLEPLRADSLVTRTDGADVGRLMTDRLRAWYADTLASAPVETLPLTDIASRLTVSRDEASGVATVTLPDDCVRVVQVMADGWERPAVTLTDSSSPLALYQLCGYTRGGCVRPVAVIHTRVMKLYTLPPGTAGLVSALCVLRPPEGTYVITDAMKRLLPTFEPAL